MFVAIIINKHNSSSRLKNELAVSLFNLQDKYIFKLKKTRIVSKEHVYVKNNIINLDGCQVENIQPE